MFSKIKSAPAISYESQQQIRALQEEKQQVTQAFLEATQIYNKEITALDHKIAMLQHTGLLSESIQLDATMAHLPNYDVSPKNQLVLALLLDLLKLVQKNFSLNMGARLYLKDKNNVELYFSVMNLDIKKQEDIIGYFESINSKISLDERPKFGSCQIILLPISNCKQAIEGLNLLPANKLLKV
jgi:hypothetical protein